MKIGTILTERYQIIEPLSQLAGRPVYLALDLQSHNSVVVKFLQFNFCKISDWTLFEQEAVVLQNLDHQSIPKYIDYFDVDEPDFRGFALVQAYIPARSLETVIRSGSKFTEAELIELADQLLSILVYLHNLCPAVVHGDIKPSNVLLGDRSGNSIGVISLVDFGAVKTVTSTNGGTLNIVGTYGYMPPEKFGGKTFTSGDLFSVGMTLIHVITGVHPADLDTKNGRVIYDRSNLSSRFSRWLNKMTEPDLDRRFNCSQTAKTALTSADGSYAEFIDLRPVDSQVEVYRDFDRLEIKLLQTDVKFIGQDFISNSLLNLFILSCFVDIIVYIGILPQAWGVMSWSARSTFLIFFPVTLALWRMSEKYVARKTYIGYQVLSIDRGSRALNVGIYSKSIREYYWKREFLKMPKIDLLAYKPSYQIDSFFDEESGKTKSGIIKTSPILSIYMGKHEYNISDNDLSELELYWLAQELSNFLDIELQIVYPTPTIPAPEPVVDPFGCCCC
jgi:serine/threonine protein kinase